MPQEFYSSASSPPTPPNSAHRLKHMYKDNIAALLEIAVMVSNSQIKKNKKKIWMSFNTGMIISMMIYSYYEILCNKEKEIDQYVYMRKITETLLSQKASYK